MKVPVLLGIFACAVVSQACGNAAASTSMPSAAVAIPAYTTQPGIASTFTPVVASTSTQIPAILPIQSCDQWQSWPVLPAVSEEMQALYRRGQLTRNNPRAFSRIGDGEISAEWFFTMFDQGEGRYDLGPYGDLAPAIEYFRGSFGRTGTAARRGFNTERILDPALGDPGLCQAGESPLTCELRLQQPAFAILSLGTNQVWQSEEFERGMRQILELLISQNVIPLLSTKGDNLDGDHRINRTIACLAQEYNVPLWNFWAAIQPLPNHGLQPDLEHLTYGITDFDDERAMQSAWTWRNLTALQALDAVWRAVTAGQ